MLPEDQSHRDPMSSEVAPDRPEQKDTALSVECLGHGAPRMHPRKLRV